MNTDRTAPFDKVSLGRAVSLGGFAIAAIAVALGLTISNPVQRLFANAFALPIAAVAVAILLFSMIIRLLQRRHSAGGTRSLVASVFTAMKLANLVAIVLLMPVGVAAWALGEGEALMQSVVLCLLFGVAISFAQAIALNVAGLRRSNLSPPSAPPA